MKSQSTRTTGISLLLGSLLMFVTMILHPGKGGLTAGLYFAIISHALAIASVPFSAVGFYGLSTLLNRKEFLSRIGLAIMLLGLLAAVMAAALNGLALPIFLMDQAVEETPHQHEILHYNRALNHTFDYILIAAMFLSTLCWSIAILLLQILPKWLGYLGISLFTIGLISVGSGFYFLDLHGFRMLIFGWVLWITGVGVSIFRLKANFLAPDSP